MEQQIINDEVLKIKLSGDILDTQIVSALSDHLKQSFKNVDFNELKFSNGFIELILDKIFTILLNTIEEKITQQQKDRLINILELVIKQIIPHIQQNELKIILSCATYIINHDLVQGYKKKAKSLKDKVKKFFFRKSLKKSLKKK